MGNPPGWATARLSEICSINPRVDKTALDPESVVSFVPMPSVEPGTGKIDTSASRIFETVRKGYTSFRTGDILFAKITPCMENGKMAIVPELRSAYGFGSTEFHVLRPRYGIEAGFVYHAVSNRSFRSHAEQNMTGAVGQKRVPATILEMHEIGLPPTNEQRRIVERIEALFGEIDRWIESLRAAKDAVALYRQSLLKSAFEGRLTAEWRARNPDKLESPDALLARVREERETRYRAALHEWEQAVAAWRKSGEKSRRPTKPKRPRTSPANTADYHFSGWTTIPLGEIIDDPIYGTSKKCGYGLGSTGVLRIPNIGSGRIDPTDLKSAEFSMAEFVKFSLKTGDILTVRSNGSLSLVGKPAIVLQQHTDYLFAGYLIRLRAISKILVPKYLVYVMTEPSVRAQIEAKAKSTSGVNNISAKELQELNVPICSVGEQAEVVRTLDTRFEAAETLDAEIDASLARADALRQSILKEAFSGRLVPQDPNDEPASALLARIRSERAEAPAARRRRRAPA